MKLKLYYSNAVDNCSKEILKNINANDLNYEHIIITPDRRTLLTEQELFEQLNKKSFFNVNVTTFTRFTNELLSKLNLNNKKLLTKPSAVAIIKKIMLENRDKLKAFKKAVNYNGIASTVFDTISMFKSCQVSFNDIEANTKFAALNNKLSDIKLLYELYEGYLQNEYTDSFNRLNLLSEILSGHNFNNVHFYILGFDDFTPQMYEIIFKLIKRSASVTVSCAASFSKVNNSNIYLNNIYLNLNDGCKLIGVTPEIIKCEVYYDKFTKILSENAFGYSLANYNLTQQENKLRVLTFDNVKNEVEYYSKLILYKIINQNLKFSDFVLVVPSINEYKAIITEQFNKLSIPFFLDINEKFADNLIIRFYLNLFEAINTGFKSEAVLALLKTLPIFTPEAVFEYEEYITTLGLSGSKILSPLTNYSFLPKENTVQIYEFLKKVKEFSGNIKTSTNICEYVNLINEFNKEINMAEIINNILTHLMVSNNIVLFKQTSQVFAKLENALNEISGLLGSYECNFLNFSAILETMLEAINLSIPPIELETVFVADSAASFISETKMVFVLGANEGKLPTALDDLGIISDKEINELNQKHKLSPTINYINKRNKFLLYEKLLKAKDQLIISYITVNEKNEELMPASFVNALLQNYVVSNDDGEKLSLETNGELLLNNLGYYTELKDSYVENFELNNISIASATDNLIKTLKDWSFYYDNSNYLTQLNTLFHPVKTFNQHAENYVNNLNHKNVYDKISNAKELFFAKDTTNVSQFETYFTCPFNHFIKYGLKLKESANSTLEPRDFGNIIHEFLKLVMPIIVKNNSDNSLSLQDIIITSEELFLKVIAQKKYEVFVNNPINFNVIESLKQETKRIVTALYEEQQVSSFVPTKYEHNFGNENHNALIIKSNDNEIKLKGVIDRVDVFEDTFRIIDYKTGQSDFNNFTDIASGKKLQLFVYVKAIHNKSKLTPVGAFYMPIKNDYVTDEKEDELYKLKGVIANSLTTIFAMDETLKKPNTKSKVVNLKTTAKGEIGNLGIKFLLSESDIEWLSNYAITLISAAYEKIISGEIEPRPLTTVKNNNSYKFNDVLGLSNFNIKYGNTFRFVENVNKFEKEKLVFQLNLLNENNNLVYNEQFNLINKKDGNSNEWKIRTK